MGKRCMRKTREKTLSRFLLFLLRKMDWFLSPVGAFFSGSVVGVVLTMLVRGVLDFLAFELSFACKPFKTRKELWDSCRQLIFEAWSLSSKYLRSHLLSSFLPSLRTQQFVHFPALGRRGATCGPFLSTS